MGPKVNQEAAVFAAMWVLAWHAAILIVSSDKKVVWHKGRGVAWRQAHSLSHKVIMTSLRPGTLLKTFWNSLDYLEVLWLWRLMSPHRRKQMMHHMTVSSNHRGTFFLSHDTISHTFVTISMTFFSETNFTNDVVMVLKNSRGPLTEG